MDYQNLKDALELTKLVSSHVNDAMNVVQNQMKMNDIDTSIAKLHESIGGSIIKPSRYFVMESDLSITEYRHGKKPKRGKKKRTVYLLSDMILLTKKGKYLAHINLKNEQKADAFRHAWIFTDLENYKQSFDIVCDDVTYSVVCNTAIECSEWVDKMNNGTCCNSAPGKEPRANRITHSKIRKVVNEENAYLIDFENNDYCMCYSPRDRVTYKFMKKDATIRDLTPEDEATFGLQDDEMSCDDQTTVSSDTDTSATHPSLSSDSYVGSLTLQEASNQLKDYTDDGQIKSPRSRGGGIFGRLGNQIIKKSSKVSLTEDDKIVDLHGLISENSFQQVGSNINRYSLSESTKDHSPLKNRQSLKEITPRSSLGGTPPRSEETLVDVGINISRTASDLQRSIEERKKTLVRREVPPTSLNNHHESPVKPSWMTELEGKKLGNRLKQVEEQAEKQ